MALRTTPPVTGRQRPSLRVLVGPGMTATAIAEMGDLELAVRMDEARAHTRRMRLVMQLPVWTVPELAALARPLLKELARYERQISESEDAA